MQKDLMQKLNEEQTLSVEEALWLDIALEANRDVPQAVSLLSDDTPSLAWRSQLNSRLQAEAAKGKKKIVFRWFSGLATTVAVTACLMVTLRGSDPSVGTRRSDSAALTPVSAGVEESLLSAHKEAVLESGMGVSWSEGENLNPSGS